MWLPLVVGALVVPYATLWASRSGRVRSGAVAIARRGVHRVVASVGVGVGLLTLAGAVPSPVVPAAWAATLSCVVVVAHVDLLVAAERMRSSPDDRALHYDLRRPRTWLTTSARIVSAWGAVMRRHPWCWPALFVSSLLFALGPRFVGSVWWLALSADTLVLALCCLPFPRLVSLPKSFAGAVESHTSTG
ncbi:hypothetical protein [Halomarina oriensis]|uniref:Uncharacterized protein n=1 Tax=Halomarina oriensis TaxID=671145 RepID=A0A6B0GK13_9EURY|nr:hypothetical protein [Halomarina oriensis]MWG35192.1 hypothetical protein [Halomarina oriensis]